MESPKITIGIPSYSYITTECVISLVKFIMTTDLPINVIFNQGLYIDHNRNQLTDVALQNGSTHLLFIDSDICFPPESPAKLLAHDKDVVGGYYNTRRGNNPIRIKTSTGLIAPDPLPTSMFQCAVLPTGFMLIKLEALKKISKPYFATIAHEHGTIGEDVSFCKKMHDAGVEIWCDPTVPLGHVGKKIY